MRDIRNTMYVAGLTVESAKGECNFGQHEIAFRYAEALTTADNHAVYKNTAKEIAAQHGRSITFMAKYNEREGNSCHIHLSLRGTDGSLAFWDSEAGGRSTLYDRFIAGVLTPWPTSPCCTRRTSTPTSDSPKDRSRRRPSPGRANWTCAVRLVGHGASARMENRLPGGDVNPYLALGAMLAGGLHGIEAELELEPEMAGNAYTSDHPRVPRTLRMPETPSPPRPSRVPHSATRSSTTTCTPQTPNWPRSTPRSPIGSGDVDLKGCRT